MHKISHIHISNFRACRNVALPLGDFTPLVGQNNVGKSTILQAIELALAPRALSKADFGDTDQPVSIATCIEGITTDLLDAIPDAKHRAAISGYCVEGKLWIQVVWATAGKKADQRVWEPASYSGAGVPDQWRAYPTGLPQAVSALFPEPLHIVAMEDLSEDLGKAKAGTTIKALLDEVMGPVLEAHEELTAALATIRNVLSTDGNSRSTHLSTFDTGATTALADFFPGLGLDVDLPAVDLKEFFRAGDLYVTDNRTGDRRKFDQMGTGAQRAIQMALVRYLAGIRGGQGGSSCRRLLLIDEPELFLHPQGVRHLREALRKLTERGFQVIFSTHSPLMLSRENASDTIIVTRASEGTAIRLPLREAVLNALSDAAAQARALFQLGNVAEIYFCERVILCEGKTDQRLLPLAYEIVYGHPAELDRICFVSLGSSSDIPKGLPVLRAMGISACAVADLDFAYTEARKGGADAWLSKDADDLKAVKAILKRLGDAEGFPLADNGLPMSKGAFTAASSWATFAKDAEGKTYSEAAHEALKAHQVWLWSVGCIEQVTGATDKGEDAILRQEEQLQAVGAKGIEASMPALKALFEWARGVAIPGSA
ncbi:ATP-dependent nuclease [Lysobacter terrae]